MKNRKSLFTSMLCVLMLVFCVYAFSACDGCKHEWGQWSVSSPSTCSTQGTRQRQCFNCNEVQSESLDIAEHDYDADNIVWAWNGFESAIATVYCTTDSTHSRQINANVTHEVATNATCTTSGVKTHTATVNIDGVAYTVSKNETLSALGHTIVTDAVVEATCEQKGLTEGSHCSVCNEVLVAQQEIPPKKHTETKIAKVDATCSAEGATEGVKCSVCNEILVAPQTINKKAHAEETIPAVAATCKKTGLTEGKKCSACDEVLVAQQEIPQKDHTETKIAAVDATCSATGATEGIKCSECNEILVAPQTINKKAHTEETIPAVAATCEKTGLSEGKKCSVCGTIIVAQKEIAATGHDYADSKIDKTIVPCKKCDEYKTVTGLFAEYVGDDIYVGNFANKNDINVYLVLDSAEKILTNDFEVNTLKITRCGTNYFNVDYYNLHTIVVISGYIAETNSSYFTYAVSQGKATITSYTGTEASVRIPETIDEYPVVAIGKSAFEDNLYIKSVMLSKNVQTIAEYAFSGCSLLDTIVLNEGLTKICYNAFEGTAITELVIPDSVTSITNSGNSFNYSIVEGCQKLKRVVIGSGLTTITTYLFQDLQALEEVVIGENVKTIESYAFDGCASLTSITIPDSVTAFDEYAFGGCVNLKNITWSSSLTAIGANAFKGCTSLTSVKLPDSVKTIYQYAFSGCSLLETIVLNEGLTKICYNAFEGTAITELVIPDSVTSITNSGNSFNYSIVEGCQKLKRVVIGSGLTTITTYLFQDLQALEEVVIGENVKTIESYAFDGCASLTSITIPDSVTQINSYAFYDSGLRNVTIPKKVDTIGDYAFSKCQKLEYLLIDGAALKKIGKNVTSSCPSARRIFYKGTITEWNAISINTTNSAPFNQIPYIFSENKPSAEGNYWHYAGNGEPIVWDISLSEYKVYALANAYTGIMGSSLLSCSSNYVQEMENDSAFMTQKAFYEMATIVKDLGTALENQMSKEQLYMIVLLDVLGYNHADKTEAPGLTDTIATYGTFAIVYLGDANKVIDVAALKKSLPALKFIKNGWDLIIDLSETAEDKRIALQHLLGFALQCQNSIDILTEIANDTSCDKDLRSAANKIIEIITCAFVGTLEDLINKNMDIQYANHISTAAINTIWDVGCSLYLPAKIAQWIATGVTITLDLFCDTGVSVDAYYKLRVTRVIENALRNQIYSLNGDYLRRENLKEFSALYAVVDLYCSAISKGYEYTLEYLNSVEKDSENIYSSYVHNTTAFRQFEIEVENTYYSLYGYE